MLERIWQWLKQLFQRLFGGTSSGGRLSDPSRPLSRSQGEIDEKPPTPKPLEDSDYEFLFMQLLEGVTHSWQQDRVVRWFEDLKERAPISAWVSWLQRFGERVTGSPALNQELGARMVNLGQMIHPVPSLQDVGAVSYEIGRQLLLRETSGVIWEYEGPDANPASAPPPPAFPAQGQKMPQEAMQTETITLDELFERLQQDPYLLQTIAQQLGIETNDPQAIVRELINQFNAMGQPPTDEV